MYKRSFAFLCLFLFTVSTVHANVIVRTADQLEIVEGDIVDGELVAVGLPVVLSNNVAQDATLLGNRVKVNGLVGGDLLAAGFFVDVDAAVADDVRIVGGEVTIASDIAGDLIVFGGTVDILSTAAILGDVVIYGGAVNIAGSVGRDVVGVMETLQINGPIGGGIDVSVTHFDLGQQASVTEAIRYTSFNLVSQSLNATIMGDIVRSDPTVLQESSWLRMTLLIFLIGLFSALVWHLTSRKTLSLVVKQSTSHLVRSAFIGFISPVVGLIIAAVLFVSQLGMYISIVLLFGLITTILLAGAAAPAVVGQLVFQILNHPNTTGPLPIVLGVLLLTVCLMLPVVGIFLIAAAFIITLGGLIESMVQANR
jgi:cytoskeletal protein CcmA (bactofilin family)